MFGKFKRAICFIGALVFVGATLAGCALFQKDVAYDNNQIVARVGSDIVITKRQLREGFNNFGYQYVSSSGMSVADAYDQTLEVLIGREIAARVSIDLFGHGVQVAKGADVAKMMDASGKQIGQFTVELGGKTYVAVTAQEAEEARQTAFNYIERGLRSIEKDTREQMGWADAPEKPAEESTAVTYNPYVKYLIRQSDAYWDTEGTYHPVSYGINLESLKDRPSAKFVYANNDDFIDFLLIPRGDTSTEKTIATQSYNHLVRNLANSEKGLGYKYDSDQQKRDAIKRELVRIQIEAEKNALVTRLEENYSRGITSAKSFTHPEFTYEQFNGLRYTNFPKFEEIVQAQNQTYVDNLVRTASQSFYNEVKNARFRFDNGFDKEGGYYDKLLDDLKSLYFVPKNVADQFFTVSHILLSYSDEQNTQLAQINAKYAQDKNKDNRDRAIEVLRSQTKVTPSDDNIPEGKSNPGQMTADQALAYIENYVGPNNGAKTAQQKANDFRDMIYMFNSDPGMQNPEFEYVIGVDLRKDKTENSLESDSMSRMVPEFTRASRELYNFDYDQKRSISARDPQNRLIGTKGAMSGLVWTDYGAHIIMYTRDISDFVYTNTAGMLDSSYENFLHATRTSYGEKTYFDVAVEAITKPAYNRYEQQLVADFKGKKDDRDRLVNQVTIYKSKFKDLTKSK
ncbi:MAG: hypothetical protein LBG88_03565 [Christensenellaceae bacterium]|jgi:hypothetical protein|nr:hypothetical protein [Christensenellaceae bacterium]